MQPLVLPFPVHEPLASRLALRLGAELGPVVVESSAERGFGLDVRGRDVVVVRGLERPDRELLPLLMLARQARRCAASTLHLVAPRLVPPHEGNGAGGALRSALRRHFDGVVTVAGDGQLASVEPWVVAPAGPALAAALAGRLRNPFFVAVGDGKPWMEDLAKAMGAPLFGAARLLGVHGCGAGLFWERNPVLLAEAIGDGVAVSLVTRELRRRGAPPPQVAVVHANATPGAVTRLEMAGIAGLSSTNTVLHPSNRADVSEAIADALWQLWAKVTEKPVRLALAAASAS